jgi:asparagine synthase (glutamine-hydrolysing)
MHRYAALLWDTDCTESARIANLAADQLPSSPSRWTVVHRGRGLLIVHSGGRARSAQAYTLQNHRGVVIGSLFRRSDRNYVTRPLIAFDDSESDRIVVTQGQHLIDNYWGKYVAIVTDPLSNTSHVLRDPTAGMSCFHTKWKGIDIYFSNIDDCLHLVPIRFTVNFEQLAIHLVSNHGITRQTGLNEVEDIPGGELQTISGSRITRRQLWNPSRLCADSPIENVAEAQHELRSAVQTAVSAWSSCYDNILHCLSGGLDSSIVAGCLAQAPAVANVTCLNLFVEADSNDELPAFPSFSQRYVEKLRRASGHGDERRFARLVAQRWGFPLVERERRVTTYDLKQAWRCPLAVLPSRFIFCIDQDTAEIDVARSVQADAVFNGQAGDTVFYTTFQTLGAIDYAYLHPLGRKLRSEISNACKLSRESLWLVLRDVLNYGLLRTAKPDIFDPLTAPQLLRSEVLGAITAESMEHPWASAKGRLPPGKRAHVAGLASSGLFYHDVFNRESLAESVFPLTSQPVVELCMRIPTYVLLAGGVSRGLARLAFADSLPDEIRRRTVKGYSFNFYQHVLQSHMDFVREMLIDGALVEEGLLDRRKVEQYLVEGQRFLTVSAPLILDYMAAESWLRQWRAVSQKRAAA